jgi:hypothetical protein
METENVQILPFPFKGGNEIWALLGYYAAKFRDTVSVPTSCNNKFLILEEGTDMLFQNVGKKLPLNTA